MDKLTRYKKANEEVPKKCLAWRIYGKGMENFGDNKKPTEIPVNEPGNDELLVRNDAVGLCFSDTKIIKLGEDHPRLRGRDIKKEPVIPGHEVALTVIKAGKNRKQYKPGSRYIVQADVYYKEVGIAYGYLLPGGLSQYGIIGKEILDGDEGSYLLPIKNENTSYSEVALVEPWACVIASYRIKHRRGIKNQGKMLILEGQASKNYRWEKLFSNNKPEKLVLSRVKSQMQKSIEESLKNSNTEIIKVEDDDIASLCNRYTDGAGFDDIIIIGDVEDEIIVSSGRNLAPYGILNYMCNSESKQVVEIDAGKIHYDRILFIGSLGDDPSTPYESNPEYSLRGNSILLLGAGGPMGQMHIQLALDNKPLPELVVVTDISNERLQTVKQKFSRVADQKGINLQLLNPAEFSNPDDYHKKISELNNGKEYDYVICLAAIPPVIEEASMFLGDKAVLNIFAGVSKGTIVKLNIKDVATKSVRYIGSSGSTIEDMQITLKKVEAGELNTNNSVAGVCGFKDVWNGMEAVRTGSFPGKIVVYPHIENLPLTSIKELKKKYPKIAAQLGNNDAWTKEAEEELLREFLSDRWA